MLIDWFTVAAQAVNFLILVWLMKRFLFKPILSAIDAREKGIASEIGNAKALKDEADKEKSEFANKNQEFDKQKAALLTQAAQDASAEKAKLIDEANRTTAALKTAQQESLIKDANDLNLSIGKRTQQAVLTIAGKVLTDLASSSLESGMVEAFLSRLSDLPGQDKAAFATAAAGTQAGGSGSAVVRSGFELLSPQRDEIQKACNDAFSSAVPIRYEVSPELIGGIEFSWNGRKVSWSIGDYLGLVEATVKELAAGQTKPIPANDSSEVAAPKETAA